MVAPLVEWKNRIVGYDTKPASDFLANNQNWRVHPMPQQIAVTAALEVVGWVQDVIVNKRTSPAWGSDRGVETMVDGHLRVTLALRKGDETPVPVKYVDLDPEEEAMVLATLDPLTGGAVADREKLDVVLHQIQTDNQNMQSYLATLANENGLYLENAGNEEVDFDGFTKPENRDVLYRVVVDGLTREEADAIADDLEGAKVEQYKSDSKK